jgi:hypothetical protein
MAEYLKLAEHLEGEAQYQRDRDGEEDSAELADLFERAARAIRELLARV